MVRFLGVLWAAALIVLLSACNGGPDPVGPDGPNGSSPDGDTSVSKKDMDQALADLEENLDKLSPYMTVNWRVPLKNLDGIRSMWINPHDVLVEAKRHELWAIRRKPGTINFGFSLEEGRRITRRPARSESRLHVVCGDGRLWVIDDSGNVDVDYNPTLKFEPSSDPAASDGHTFMGSDGDRYFYAWDVDNDRYAERKRLEEKCGARPVLSPDGTRVYFASNDGQAHSLSIEQGRFFDSIWSKKCFDKVVAPLTLHPHAPLLYVCGAETGTLYAYNVHNGNIQWSVVTEAEITQQAMGNKDRCYIICENGDADKNGLWCVKAIDPKGGTASTVLWKYNAANKILAIGKKHIYVRIGDEGNYSIAVVRAEDGKVDHTVKLDPRFTFFVTNPHASQIVVGVSFKDQVGLIFSAQETE